MTDTEINTLGPKEAFLTLSTYLPEAEEFDKEAIEEKRKTLTETYEKARFGITIKFDIYDFINDQMTTKTKTGKILYRNKTIELTSFWTELEQRTILIKKWLNENIKDEGIVTTYDI